MGRPNYVTVTLGTIATPELWTQIYDYCLEKELASHVSAAVQSNETPEWLLNCLQITEDLPLTLDEKLEKST